MKVQYGQRLVKLKGHRKPNLVYVVSKENDHLVQVSNHWPYIPGVHESFHVNAAKLPNLYAHEKYGIQQSLFFAVPTYFDALKQKHLIPS